MYEKFGKRTLDIAISIVAIIILSIPMLLTALWIKFDSKGPVIFKQPRYGKGREPFTVYKFRTMSISAPSNVATNSLKDGKSHITRSGRIMRKLSIDELPQLFNVLAGDMSVIGPRPVILAETNLIRLREAVGANSVKPGITGWAQANGRDELDDITKAEMDGCYVDNFGPIMDLRCILKTITVILTAAGHAEGHQQHSSKNAEPVGE